MPEAYVNYYKKSLEAISRIPSGHRPTLLMHVCCGPCSTFPLTFLCPHFEVSIIYNNSNIYPEEEYVRRLEELKRFLTLFKKDYGYEVKLIEVPYDNDAYNVALAPYASDREGGMRCHICYRKRMSFAYDYAESHGFEYFCTVMSISRQKDEQILNAIGADLQKSHPHTKYFFSDFKKNKGIDAAREMRIRYGLYNQLYCGCKYTYGDGLVRAAQNTKKWQG